MSKEAAGAEIKEAIEKIYEIPGKKVAVMNVKGKVKRNARGFSKRASWKIFFFKQKTAYEIDFS